MVERTASKDHFLFFCGPKPDFALKSASNRGRFGPCVPCLAWVRPRRANKLPKRVQQIPEEWFQALAARARPSGWRRARKTCKKPGFRGKNADSGHFSTPARQMLRGDGRVGQTNYQNVFNRYPRSGFGPCWPGPGHLASAEHGKHANINGKRWRGADSGAFKRSLLWFV